VSDYPHISDLAADDPFRIAGGQLVFGSQVVGRIYHDRAERPNPLLSRSVDLEKIPVELRGAVAAGHLCAKPLVLYGQAAIENFQADRETGVLPDGINQRSFALPCGNRRAHACPHCSKKYQRDLYRIVNEEVTAKQSLTFVTLTADGMAVEPFKACPMHLAPLKKKSGKLSPRKCPCGEYHASGDDRIGAPLNPARFDARRAASFNCASGALMSDWIRRFRREVRNRERNRLFALLDPALRGHDQKLAKTEAREKARIYARAIKICRVAEVQDRGLIHHHMMILGLWPDELLRKTTDVAAAFLDGYRHTYSATKHGCHAKQVLPGQRLATNNDPGRMYSAYISKYVCKSFAKIVETATGESGAHYARIIDQVMALEDERAEDEENRGLDAWDDWRDAEISSFVSLRNHTKNPAPRPCLALKPNDQYEYAVLLKCRCPDCIAWRRKRRASEYLGLRGHPFSSGHSWGGSFSAIRTARREYASAAADEAWAKVWGDTPRLDYGSSGWRVTGCGLNKALDLEDGLMVVAGLCAS